MFTKAILLPDPMEREFLKIWSQTGLPRETVDRIIFYIGDDEGKYILKGVAGETFLTRELRIGHMKLEKDIWRCDNHCYINFKESWHAPAYRSFVCMPIIGPTSTPAGRDSITCLGVVCFDSPDESVFDTIEAKTILRIFARRIAAALLIYRLLP